MELAELRLPRLIVRAMSVAIIPYCGACGFGLWRVVVFVPGMSFNMSPVFRLGNWRFTHGTITVSAFVKADKIRMDCQVARTTNCWRHFFLVLLVLSIIRMYRSEYDPPFLVLSYEEYHSYILSTRWKMSCGINSQYLRKSKYQIIGD